MITRRAFCSVIAGSMLAAGGIGNAMAFPDRPVDYVIPFGPGGESDISARFQQPFFKEMFDQDLVVSYKPGGGGAVGWAELNSHGDDGHKIMGVNLPHIVIQPAQKDVGYTTDGLVPIYWFHYTPDAIVVPADSEFQTLEALVEHARSNPGKVIFSGSGKGSANHLAQVAFDQLADIQTTYVAFKGTGASVTALLGKQVTAQWGYTTVGAAQGDQVRLLAVAMEQRHPMFPDVPTFRELGYELVGGAYRGIAVPDATPEDLRKQWSDMIAQINASPEFQKKMLDGGFAMMDVSYENMSEFMEARKAAYIEAARAAEILE
jgi:tripartite-type tricarboxylate transporter receptor subunit TctC